MHNCRNVEVERLESRVVGELALYEGVCKSAREELKRSFNTRQQEMNHRRNLERAKSRHPQNRQQIVCISLFRIQIVITYTWLYQCLVTKEWITGTTYLTLFLIFGFFLLFYIAFSWINNANHYIVHYIDDSTNIVSISHEVF